MFRGGIHVRKIEIWFTLVYVILLSGYITKSGTWGCRRRGKIEENSRIFKT